ncbi:MAG TPA: hypothetical protein VFI29_11245 [Hanamia sp.]|nr:hypothetical protein [Hanamia sp.]
MKKIIIIASALFFLGCNSSTNSKTDNATTGNTSTATTKTDAATSGLPGTEITLTLKGGANAGSYSARSVDPTCSEGLTGDNSFGNQYSVKGKADNELSSLQLIIDDKNAAKKGTDKFSIMVGFGKLAGGKTYEINTRDNSKEGSGKATLTETGHSKIVIIEGKTADGIIILATITCHGVMTPNGIQ